MDPSHVASVLLSRKASQIDFEALQRVEADRLLAEVVDQRIRIRALRDLALAQGHIGVPMALQCEASIRETLELEIRMLAPLLGERVAKSTAFSVEGIKRIERVVVDGSGQPVGEPGTIDATPASKLAAEAEPPSTSEPSAPTPPEPAAPPPPETEIVPITPRRQIGSNQLFGFSSITKVND